MYILDGAEIRRPHEISEGNSTQMAAQRTLDGSMSRDYFGSTKRIWNLQFVNIKPADYQVIRNIYDSYIATGDTKTFEITESAYTVASTPCHLDFVDRGFSVRGSTYLSDCELVITEA